MARITVTTRIATTLLGGLAALGAATAIGSAPTANATCVSAFGINNSGDCASNLTSVAIAIGTGAQALADGLLGVAFAFGDTAFAQTTGSGIGNLAVTVGSGSTVAAGYVSAAINVGPGSRTVITPGPGFANLAIDLGGQLGVTQSDGIGSLAVNLFGGGAVVASGNLTNAFNLGGAGSIGTTTSARGTFSNAIKVAGSENGIGTDVNGFANWAVAAFGSNNAVGAGPGPLALAGSIAQTGQTITKFGPGININGLVIGGAASSPAPAPAATSHRARKASPAAIARAATPRPAAAAASRARSR